MRKILLAGTAVMSLAVFGGTSAQAATDTVTVDAVIVVPIAVNTTQNLHFGQIDADAAGKVTVDTLGGRTTAGPSILGALHQEATIDVTGEINLAFDINTTAASITIDDVGAGAPMTVDNWQFDDPTNPPGAGPYASNLGAGGAVTISMGADLDVALAQVPGAYTGTVTVEALYQ